VIPELLIDQQVARQQPVVSLRVLEEHRVGLLQVESQVKALALAIGARHVGPDPDIIEIKDKQGLANALEI
jgi:hypothetical protein